jgi:hypothetical protein
MTERISIEQLTANRSKTPAAHLGGVQPRRSIDPNTENAPKARSAPSTCRTSWTNSPASIAVARAHGANSSSGGLAAETVAALPLAAAGGASSPASLRPAHEWLRTRVTRPDAGQQLRGGVLSAAESRRWLRARPFGKIENNDATAAILLLQSAENEGLFSLKTGYSSHPSTPQQ